MTAPGVEPISSTILIVEDEALIAEDIKERVTRLGFRVIGTADTADKAVQTATSKRPDLVLMDIRLKGKRDGIEAGSEIRDRLSIPVVYLTAHSDRATIRRAEETGPFGFLLKPFEERELLVAIEMAISRHRLDQQLKESEVRYSATLKSIGDAVISTDEFGRVTFMNPAAVALTGWTFQEAEGVAIENVVKLVDETSHKPLENPLRRALQQGTSVFCAPALMEGRGDQPIPVEDSTAPIVTEDGRMIGAVIALKDIRERRLAEQALQRSTEQLRQSQKMESLGRLTGGIAHDFNNLLTVINGYSKLLLHRGHLDEDAAEDIREIADAGDRAAALVHQLMAFSRRQIIVPKVLDLNHLVRNTDRLLGRLIGEDIRLVMKLYPEQVRVLVDSSQIEQLLMNLAVNARDAMPEGGELSIETNLVRVDDAETSSRPDMEPGNWAVLTVTDTGCGMDEATKARIFEPFFTSKDIGDGTGLGLATVHGIVKQSGGFIYVSSEPGLGATFDVYLPAIAGPVTAVAAPEKSNSPGYGDETILLAEDEAAVRGICASVLRSYGYTVLEADCGDEAIRICEHYKWPIHMLVTDVVMPRMSGSKLAAHISGLLSGIKVLYMTGYTDDTILRQGVVEGKVALIQKPFTEKMLAAAVRELLDLRTLGNI